jgi:para-nitrobenzyl esterase
MNNYPHQSSHSWLVATTLAAFLLVTASFAAQPANVVRVEQGELAGKAVSGGITAFLGVPYAKPPVGDLRWRSPEPPEHWSGIRSATAFGPAAVQSKNPENGPWDHHWHPDPPFVEDCLHLNVWTPAKAGANLPVAFWIHGGGLTQGGSSSETYDGTEFAKLGVVFVSLNYRLGVPGFFAHPALSAESPDHVSGNYGMQDNIAALKWVQKNIAQFGGDPSKVTIIGQSAGGRTVQVLLSSPRAKGLFRGAIAESSIPWVMPRPGGDATLAQLEKAGVEYAQAKGATTLEGLRKVPESALAVPLGGVGSTPQIPGSSFPTGFAVDGVWLPKQTSESVIETPISDVPVLIGHNQDEGDVRLPLTQKVPAADFQKRAQDVYAGRAAEFLALYPVKGDDAAKAQQAAGHDRVLFGVRQWAARRTAHAKSPVFLYNFGHAMPGYTKEKWGSFHTSEVPYWMKTYRVLGRPFTADDEKVSQVLSTYWLNFIKTGNPNGDGMPAWKPVNGKDAELMELGPKPGMRPISSDAKIEAFFTRMYPN